MLDLIDFESFIWTRPGGVRGIFLLTSHHSPILTSWSTNLNLGIDNFFLKIWV